jgi:trk system potassium uptake protein TrkA
MAGQQAVARRPVAVLYWTGQPLPAAQENHGSKGEAPMKIVIMGCGRVGAMLAGMMVSEKLDVTVIDSSNAAFARLGANFRGCKIVGDGTDADVLRRAGIEEADYFAAVTNGDNRNIMAAQIAQHIFHVPRVVCRIYDPIRQETYQSLGLQSICPTIIGANLLHDALLHPEDSTTSAALAIAEGRSVPTTPIVETPVDTGAPKGARTVSRETFVGESGLASC